MSELFDPIPFLNKAVICTDQSVPRILLMDARKDWSMPDAVLWQWRPLEDPVLLPDQRNTFAAISDCKVISGGRELLIVASGGGVVIVDIPTCKAVFYGFAGGNTHSAAQLPDGTVAAVSSSGNYISLFRRPEIFDPHSIPVRKEYFFEDAHGCLWDKYQSLLWIWGRYKIESYRYNGCRNAPEITAVQAYHPRHGILPKSAPDCPDIPDDDSGFPMGGHDLYPIPGTQKVFLTCHYGVMTFDTVTHEFALFNATPHVKSLTQNPETKQILYQIPAERWWTDTVQTLDGKTFRLPGARFYKVRWYAVNDFSE